MNKKVDIYRSSNEVLNDSINRVVVNINLKRKRYGYKLFGLCGSEPRVGTTTMAINIAVAAATFGYKVLLVDASFQKEVSCKRLSDKIDNGLIEYISGECDVEDIIYDTSIENLHFIPSGNRDGFPVEVLCSEKLDWFMDQIKDYYDFVFFDMPAINTSLEMLVFNEKMDTVMVVSATHAERDVLNNCKKLLEKQGVNYLGVIANKIDKTEYDPYMRNYDYFSKKKYLKKMSKF